jgi:DNA-binding response OmpR family regulator
VKQCSILIVNCGAEPLHRQVLERIGFHVSETTEWPDDDLIKTFQVVIVAFRHMESVAMLATRMRAKPHFGQRVLIAIVPVMATADERRAALGSGFDDVVSESKDSRPLVARILRRLRSRPEHRCFLPDRKRRAA